jgi:DNA-binding protein YbaB
MFTPDTQSLALGEKIHQELTSYQIRAEAGKAIAVVSGAQDVLRVYGTDMDYESNQVLLEDIAKAANDALRASEMAAAVAVMGSEDLQDALFKQAKESTYVSKSGSVTVEADGVQNVTKVEGEGLDPAFAADMVKAINAAFAKSMMAMGDVLVKLSGE